MSYAGAWLKWFDVIEEGACALSARMIALAGLDRATSVLDIGTGIGEPAFSAARLVPAGGRVTALDSDPAMIDLARARAAKVGVRNVDFHVCNVESADLPEAGFDVILARWSLMFVGDLPTTLGKLAAALRPGGRLVAGLWCDGARVPALTLAESAVFEHFGWPPEDRAMRKAFSFSDEACTVALFERAGYPNVSTAHCEVVYHFETPAAFVQYRRDVGDAIWSRMAGKPEADWTAAVRAIEDRIKPCLTADGRYRLVNHAYCIAGSLGDGTRPQFDLAP